MRYEFLVMQGVLSIVKNHYTTLKKKKSYLNWSG